MAAIALARQARWVAAQTLFGIACLTATLGQETPKKEKVVPVPVGGPVAALPPAFKAATGKFSLTVEKVLRAGIFADAAEQEATRKFFELHVAGLSDAEVVPAVGKLRQSVRTYMAITGNAPAQTVHTFVRQYLFDECKKVVADEKQPMIARVNALGIVGDLNQKEVSPAPPAPPAPGAPPHPLAAVTPYLVGVFEDAKMPSALRVVALRGLRRHAQLGLPNKADVPTVETAMLKAVQDTNVPTDCSEAAHEWFRRSAVEILGSLNSANAAQVVIDIVADANLSLAFRCDAARSLGHLDLKQGDPAVGNVTAAQRLGDLAATVAETVADRRALHEYLDCVRVGLNGPGREAKTLGGVRAATPQADAKLVGDVFALVEPMVKQVDPSTRPITLKDENLGEAMPEFAQKIRDLGIAAAPPPVKAKTKAPESGKGKAPEPGKGKEAKPAAQKEAKPAPE